MTEESQPRRRRAWPWLVTLVGLWLVGCAVITFLGIAAAQSGASELRDVRGRFEVTDLADADIDLGVDQAADDFRRSSGHLGNPILAPARLLPVVGRQIRAADALAESGSTVLDTMIELREELVSRTEDGFPAGAARVEFLTWLRDELHATATTLGDLDLGPDRALVAPLDRARRTVDENLELVRGAVDDAAVASDAALAVFGQRSRYLVVAANNAEMRVGSGMFLSLGELRIDAGTLTVGDFESVEDLTLTGRVEAPAEVEALWGWANPGREWRNLGLTPDFTVNGAMAAQMWTELGREPVDGVLLVDVPTLALLLEVTGPVTDPDGVRFDSENVEKLLLHDQYLAIDGPESNEARREQLAVVAKAVLTELDRPGLDLGALATALQEAQRGRNLLAWSTDDRQQAGWETLGIDGDIGPDDVLIGVANLDASKMDPFVGVGVDVAVDADGPVTETGEVAVTFEVSLHNRTPKGEPEYVRGYDPEATYDGVVVAYLPAWATAIEVDGGELVATGREDGNLVVGVAVSVPRQELATVRIVVAGPTRSVENVTLRSSGRRPGVGWSTAEGKPFTDRRRRSVNLYGS